MYLCMVPLAGWSMTKSVLSALVGMRVKDGAMHLDDPALLPRWTESMRKQWNITIRNLLHMNTGMGFKEEYIKNLRIGSVVRMIFAEHDTAQFAHDRIGMENKTGEVFYYSSGTSNILSSELRATFKGDNQAYWNYPFRNFFSKFGAHSFTMETDPSGTFVGSSFSAATARDWGKFGFLHLNKGFWNGVQILPEGWTDFVQSPSVSPSYGAHFWVNEASHKPWTSKLPPHFRCDGYEFQTVIMIPSLDAVLVRLGNTKKDRDFNALDYFSSVLDVLQKEEGVVI